jgi:hypothetical protein
MLTTSTDFVTKIAIALRTLWNLPPTTAQKNSSAKGLWIALALAGTESVAAVVAAFAAARRTWRMWT